MGFVASAAVTSSWPSRAPEKKAFVVPWHPGVYLVPAAHRSRGTRYHGRSFTNPSGWQIWKDVEDSLNSTTSTPLLLLLRRELSQRCIGPRSVIANRGRARWSWQPSFAPRRRCQILTFGLPSCTFTTPSRCTQHYHFIRCLHHV